MDEGLETPIRGERQGSRIAASSRVPAVLLGCVMGLFPGRFGLAEDGPGGVDVCIQEGTVTEETAGGVFKPLAPGGCEYVDRTSTLVLGDDAVVFMAASGDRKAEAEEFQGRRRLPLSDFTVPPRERWPEAQRNQAIYAPRVTGDRVGAARGDAGRHPRLLRPASTKVLGLSSTALRWECESCGALTWRLYDDPFGSPLWEGTGEGHVAYDGPSLAAGGTYYLQTEMWNEPLPIVVVAESVRDSLERALRFCSGREEKLRGAGVTHPGLLMSCRVSAYRSKGLETAALELLARVSGTNPVEDAPGPPPRPPEAEADRSE